MGWKIKRPRIKLTKGVYLNLNKNGMSISSRNKYVSKTTNLKTGETRTTVRTPFPGISYTTSSGDSNKVTRQKANKPHSPTTYKVCGWIAVIIGIFATLLGSLTFTVGGFIVLIFGIILILLGISWIKRAKVLLQLNTDLLTWQNVIMQDSQNKLAMTEKQLQETSDKMAANSLRIVQDCLQLLSETTKPDTFFSRLDLLKKESKTLASLEPYIKFSGVSPTVAFNELLDQEQEAIRQFLIRYFTSVYDKAMTLKTEKGRKNQYQKFYDTLQPYYQYMNDNNIDYIETKYKVYVR